MLLLLCFDYNPAYYHARALPVCRRDAGEKELTMQQPRIPIPVIHTAAVLPPNANGHSRALASFEAH